VLLIFSATVANFPIKSSAKSTCSVFPGGKTGVILFRATVALTLYAALTVSPALASRVHRAPTSGRSHIAHKSTRSHRLHGQEAIEPARVIEIQRALVREHYLTIEPNGRWEATTEAAMQKYQADNGWQTRLMPDSRALKKLGLGPDYSNAINAKNSSFAAPPPAATIPPVQAAGFVEASGISH
jgi:hypothetical protein